MVICSPLITTWPFFLGFSGVRYFVTTSAPHASGCGHPRRRQHEAAYVHNSGNNVLTSSTRRADGSRCGIPFTPSYRSNHRRGSPIEWLGDLQKNFVAGEGTSEM